MSQLASLASRPDPAADTLAHYQGLPVAHHKLEEAAYLSGALGVDDVVGLAASLDPSPEVIHIDMRSPTRNSYLGGRGWATTLWREVRRQLPSLKFLHVTPSLPSLTSSSIPCALTLWGSLRTPTSRCAPLLTSSEPPYCDMVCLQDLAAGAPADHSFFPFSWHLANPRPGGLIGNPNPAPDRVWGASLEGVRRKPPVLATTGTTRCTRLQCLTVTVGVPISALSPTQA